MRPEWAAALIDTSGDAAAILSAARWVKDNNPQLFVANSDRAIAYQVMTQVIGILRAHGCDARRCVNHPDRPVGDPFRYGSDSLVLNGVVWDCYQGMGDPNMSRPQALNVGSYAANRPID